MFWRSLATTAGTCGLTRAFRMLHGMLPAKFLFAYPCIIHFEPSLCLSSWRSHVGKIFGSDFFLFFCRYELAIFPAEFILQCFCLFRATPPRASHQRVIGFGRWDSCWTYRSTTLLRTIFFLALVSSDSFSFLTLPTYFVLCFFTVRNLISKFLSPSFRVHKVLTCIGEHRKCMFQNAKKIGLVFLVRPRFISFINVIPERSTSCKLCSTK